MGMLLKKLLKYWKIVSKQPSYFGEQDKSTLKFSSFTSGYRQFCENSYERLCIHIVYNLYMLNLFYCP